MKFGLKDETIKKFAMFSPGIPKWKKPFCTDRGQKEIFITDRISI